MGLVTFPQQFLYFFPLPQGQGSFLPIFFLPIHHLPKELPQCLPRLEEYHSRLSIFKPVRIQRHVPDLPQIERCDGMCDLRANFQQAQVNYLTESLPLERQRICINMNEVAIIVKELEKHLVNKANDPKILTYFASGVSRLKFSLMNKGNTSISYL